MNTKRIVRARKIEATPYLISEDEKIAGNKKTSIYIAYNNQAPNQELVAKIVYFRNNPNIQSTKIEIQKIIKLQQQQNLVKYHSLAFLDQSSFCLIMDYYHEGSIHSFAQSKLMPQEKIWQFIQQICKGYQKIFDHNLLHLKIKPSNILISEKNYKISDIGFNSKDQIFSLISNKTSNKDLLYMPPETGQLEISSKFDMYSLGCIIYQLAYDGIHPFEAYLNENISIQDYFQKIRTIQLILKQKNKKGEFRSPELRDLIKRMLQIHAQKRISWQRMFQHERISINRYHEKRKQITNQKENQIEMLRKTLINVNRSSVIISQNVQYENQQSIPEVFIALQKILDKQQIKYIQRVMLRFKIILLTIIHCNNKINSIIRQNARHKKLPGYIIDAIKKIVVEGLLYLLKNIDIISNRINDFKEDVIKEVRAILNADRQRILNEYKKEIKIFKNIDEQTFMNTLKNYDLRSYQHCLYNILTVYCDYHKDGKQILRVTIAILIDIYDTALRLTEMTQKQKISLRSLDYEEIQTEMDSICLSPHRAQQFHNYLMKKQFISEDDLTKSLKQLGLLFV